MSYPSDTHPPYLSCPSPRSSPRLAPSSNTSVPRPSSSLSSSTASNNSNHGDSHHGGVSGHLGDGLNHRGDPPGGRVFLSPQLGRKNLLRKQTSIDYRVKNRLTVDSGLESRSRSYDNLYQPRPSSREGLSRDFGGGLTRDLGSSRDLSHDLSRVDPSVITSREVAQRVMRPDKHSPLPPRVNFSPKGPKKAL